MRRLLLGVFAAILLLGSSFAQDTSSAPASASTSQAQPGSVQSGSVQSGQPTSSLRLAPGSVIPVQLTKTVDAKKAKTGDEVEAKVTSDLKSQSGEVIVPKDTKVVGRVTEAQARSKDQKESEVGIAFDHAVLKDGSLAPLPMSIQAVIAPPNRNPDNAVSGAPGGTRASAGPGVPGRAGNPSGSMAGPPPTPGENLPGDQSSANGGNGNPNITAQTRGVVGLADYSLSTPANATQGSVVSSEKGNVKLENGTLMLLRVNQTP